PQLGTRWRIWLQRQWIYAGRDGGPALYVLWWRQNKISDACSYGGHCLAAYCRNDIHDQWSELLYRGERNSEDDHATFRSSDFHQLLWLGLRTQRIERNGGLHQ